MMVGCLSSPYGAQAVFLEASSPFGMSFIRFMLLCWARPAQAQTDKLRTYDGSHQVKAEAAPSPTCQGTLPIWCQ